MCLRRSRGKGDNLQLVAAAKLESGEAPALELVEGALLVFTGALLLTPGFLTDIAGLACLLPRIRRTLAEAILSRMLVQLGEASMQGGQRGGNRSEHDVIEGEFRRTDAKD